MYRVLFMFPLLRLLIVRATSVRLLLLLELLDCESEDEEKDEEGGRG